MANMTFKANLLPNSDQGYSLGTATLRWKINGFDDPLLTDENVTQNQSTTSSWQKILLGSEAYADVSHSQTTAITDQVYQTIDIEANPSLGQIKAKQFLAATTSSSGKGFEVSNNGYSVGQFYASQSGTESQTGYAVFTLGNSTASGAMGNARGQINLYGSEDVRHVIFSSLTHDNGTTDTGNYRYVFLQDYAGSQYLIHAGSNSAVGNANQPVYIAANGRVTAGTSVTGTYVHRAGDTMTGNLTIGTSADAATRELKLVTDAGSISLFSRNDATEKKQGSWAVVNGYRYWIYEIDANAKRTFWGRLADQDQSLHPVVSSYYGGNAYENIKNHNNGNITLDANSGKLFLGYQSTTSLYFLNGKAVLENNGTLVLSNTADAAIETTPTCALVIGPKTGAHIEIDTNEILAKSNGTTGTTLYLQDGNGTVNVSGSGGLNVTQGHVNITGSSKHLYIENGKLVVGASSIYTQRTGQSTTYSFGMFVNGDAYVKSTFNSDLLRIWGASSTSRIPAAWYNDDILYGYFRYLTGNSTSKGYSQLWLGNGRPSGTANNACGQIVLYGTSTTFTSIYGSTTALGGTTRTYLSMAYVAGTQIWGAVYNDYAEFRETKEEIEPGRCVTECGDGSLKLSTERLMRGGEIVSDTYGFAIGATNTAKTPIAASGRVLAYCYEGQEYAKEHIGYPVGTGPKGTVSIMSEEEERLYPSRIIGIISEVPTYEIWQKGSDEDPEYVNVNGRIWIRVR